LFIGLDCGLVLVRIRQVLRDQECGSEQTRMVAFRREFDQPTTTNRSFFRVPKEISVPSNRIDEFEQNVSDGTPKECDLVVRRRVPEVFAGDLGLQRLAEAVCDTGSR
jgi:hypothetical protein